MKIKIYISIIAVLMTSFSCHRKETPSKIVYIKNDSIVEKTIEKLRIDTVLVAGDTIVSTVYIQCPDGGKPTVIGGNANSNRAYTQLQDNGNGNYLLYGGCAAMKKEIISKDSIIESLQKTTKEVVITKVVKEKYIPKLYQWSFWICIGLIVLGLGKIVIRFYKPF